MRTAHGAERHAVAGVAFDGRSAVAARGSVLRSLRSGVESCQGTGGLSVSCTAGTAGKAGDAQP